MQKQTESEFGRGLVICLVKFAEHFENRFMERIVNQQRQEIPNTALSYDIKIWATGASDHLYEMEVPRKWKDSELAKKIKELQTKGLDMGHSFKSGFYTIRDVENLKKLTIEIAFLIDKKLGLADATLGSW